MILLFLTRREYARLTRPSAQRARASAMRAAGTVFPSDVRHDTAGYRGTRERRRRGRRSRWYRRRRRADRRRRGVDRRRRRRRAGNASDQRPTRVQPAARCDYATEASDRIDGAEHGRADLPDRRRGVLCEHERRDARDMGRRHRRSLDRVVVVRSVRRGDATKNNVVDVGAVVVDRLVALEPEPHVDGRLPILGREVGLEREELAFGRPAPPALRRPRGVVRRGLDDQEVEAGLGVQPEVVGRLTANPSRKARRTDLREPVVRVRRVLAPGRIGRAEGPTCVSRVRSRPRVRRPAGQPPTRQIGLERLRRERGVRRPRAQDVRARRREVDRFGAEVGEVRKGVVLARRGNADQIDRGVVARVRREVVVVLPVVPGGDDEERRPGGSIDRVLHQLRVAAASEARVHDLGAVRGGIREAVRDGRIGSAGRPEHAYRHERDGPVHAGDADAVVPAGADRSGDVRPMALFVSGVGVVCEEVVARDHVLREVRVVVGDTSVDDGDLDATATGGDVPGLGRVDVVVARLIQAPKLAEPRGRSESPKPGRRSSAPRRAPRVFP